MTVDHEAAQINKSVSDNALKDESSTLSSAQRILRARFQRRLIILIFGFALVLVLALLSFTVGTRDISFETTWNAIFNFDPSDSQQLLVVHLRVPRTLLAILVGGSLGVAGAIMQALTRNPLADPGLLGVNSGAAVAITFGIVVFGISSVTGYMFFGIIGAAVAGTTVYLLGGARSGTNPIRLVLAGAALSVVLMSLAQIILVNSDEQVFEKYRHWTVGSLQGRGYEVLVPILLLMVVGLVLAFSLTKSLDTVSLGKDLSQSLGVSATTTWSLSAIAVIVLAGAATAAAGPVGFIGLTAPHLARFIVGPDHKWVLPYSIMIGANLTLGADVLGRVIAMPGEVGVGIMVALIGGPFFVALVRGRKIVQL